MSIPAKSYGVKISDLRGASRFLGRNGGSPRAGLTRHENLSCVLWGSHVYTWTKMAVGDPAFGCFWDVSEILRMNTIGEMFTPAIFLYKGIYLYKGILFMLS